MTTSLENLFKTREEISAKIKTAIHDSDNLYMVPREDIFHFLASVTALSDEVSDFTLAIDEESIGIEKSIRSKASGVATSAVNAKVKEALLEYVMLKDWAKLQLSTLKDLRISALSAQRSAE